MKAAKIISIILILLSVLNIFLSFASAKQITGKFTISGQAVEQPQNNSTQNNNQTQPEKISFLEFIKNSFKSLFSFFRK